MLGPDAADAAAVRPADPAPGWIGRWFARPDLSATPPVRPTLLSFSFLNRLLAELRNLFAAASIVESGNDESQVLEAIRFLVAQPKRHLVEILASTAFVVPAGVRQVRFRLVGAGGAGGGCVPGAGGRSGGGGAAGVYAEGLVDVAPGDTLTIVVGAGGVPVAGGPGGNGGATSIAHGGSPVAECDGGAGGGCTGTAGSPGGLAGTGTIAPGIAGFYVYGGCGEDGDGGNGGTRGGQGGASAFGGGGRAGTLFGVDGPAFGSGGGGAYGQASTGGNGGAGVVILDWVA